MDYSNQETHTTLRLPINTDACDAFRLGVAAGTVEQLALVRLDVTPGTPQWDDLTTRLQQAKADLRHLERALHASVTFHTIV